MFDTIIFFSLNLLILIGDVASGLNTNHHRNKRYLIYPNAGPSRTQFIFGLGVPVDLKDQSLTIGTVIKMQYLVPVNSSEYTTRIYGFANTVSRDMNGDVINSDADEDLKEIQNEQSINDSESISTIKEFSDIDNEGDNNTLVDINFDENSENRRKRDLMYMEGGDIDNTLNSNDQITLEEAIERQEKIDQKNNMEQAEPEQMNRWDFYKILERTAERYGYIGRPCLLRTICEAAEVPFTYRNGLFGEIGHILFTPSTSTDELSHHTDNEYHAAERLGRELELDCKALFPECETSVLGTFTQIGLNALHKFGLK